MVGKETGGGTAPDGVPQVRSRACGVRSFPPCGSGRYGRYHPLVAMMDTGMTDPPSVLAAVLTELGWKPEVLARRLNRFATLHGRGEQVHAKTPYKWLRGDHPRSPWPALIAALLTEELGRPITTADLGWGADEVEAISAISGLVLPWTAAGSLRAVRVVTEAGSVERRILLTLLGGAACAPAHEWLIARPEADAARPSGSPLPVGCHGGSGGHRARTRARRRDP
jgi:hypothetical protein